MLYDDNIKFYLNTSPNGELFSRSTKTIYRNMNSDAGLVVPKSFGL